MGGSGPHYFILLMKRPNPYQLDLFENSVTIRITRRKSPGLIPQRDRDSEGRYVKDPDHGGESEIEKIKRELETEKRRNYAVASMIRMQDETILILKNKLKEYES